MKEIINKINTLDKQTQNVIKKGEEIYNSIRNVGIYMLGDHINGYISLQDKKCLALYLSIIQGNNFFNSLLTDLNYKKFTDFSVEYTNNYHYEDEYYTFVNSFLEENLLEVLTLYLLESPIIKQLNAKEGYSLWKMKIAVYDYLGNKAQQTLSQEKSAQKVLTK